MAFEAFTFVLYRPGLQSFVPPSISSPCAKHDVGLSASPPSRQTVVRRSKRRQSNTHKTISPSVRPSARSLRTSRHRRLLDRRFSRQQPVAVQTSARGEGDSRPHVLLLLRDHGVFRRVPGGAGEPPQQVQGAEAQVHPEAHRDREEQAPSQEPQAA